MKGPKRRTGASNRGGSNRGGSKTSATPPSEIENNAKQPTLNDQLSDLLTVLIKNQADRAAAITTAHGLRSEDRKQDLIEVLKTTKRDGTLASVIDNIAKTFPQGRGRTSAKRYLLNTLKKQAAASLIQNEIKKFLVPKHKALTAELTEEIKTKVMEKATKVMEKAIEEKSKDPKYVESLVAAQGVLRTLRQKKIKAFNQARTEDPDVSIASISTAALSEHATSTEFDLNTALEQSKANIDDQRKKVKKNRSKNRTWKGEWDKLSTYVGGGTRTTKSDLNKLLSGDTASLKEEKLNSMLKQILDFEPPKPEGTDTPIMGSSTQAADSDYDLTEDDNAASAPKEYPTMTLMAVKSSAERLVRNQLDFLAKEKKLSAVRGYNEAINADKNQDTFPEVSAPQSPLAVSSFSSKRHDTALSASRNHLDFAQSVEKIAGRGLLSADSNIDYVSPLSVVTPDEGRVGIDGKNVLTDNLSSLDSLIDETEKITSSPTHKSLYGSLSKQKANLEGIKGRMQNLDAAYSNAKVAADEFQEAINEHLNRDLPVNSNQNFMDQEWDRERQRLRDNKNPLKSKLTFKIHRQHLLAEIASLSSCPDNELVAKKVRIKELWNDYDQGINAVFSPRQIVSGNIARDVGDPLFRKTEVTTVDGVPERQITSDDAVLNELIKKAEGLRGNLKEVKDAYKIADAQNGENGSPDGATVLTDDVCKRLSSDSHPKYTEQVTALQEKSAEEVEALYTDLTTRLENVQSESEAYKAKFTKLVARMNAKREIALQKRATFRLQQLREKNGLGSFDLVEKINIDPLVTLNQSYEKALALMINSQFAEAEDVINNCFKDTNKVDSDATCYNEAHYTRLLLFSILGDEEAYSTMRQEMLKSANGNFDMLSNDLFPGQTERENDDNERSLERLKNKICDDLSPKCDVFDDTQDKDKAANLKAQATTIEGKIESYNQLIADMNNGLTRLSKNDSASVREFRSAAMANLCKFARKDVPMHIDDFKDFCKDKELHDFFNLTDEDSILVRLRNDIKTDIDTLNRNYKSSAHITSVSRKLNTDGTVRRIKNLKIAGGELADPKHYIFKSALKEVSGKETLMINDALNQVEKADAELKEKLGGRNFATMYADRDQLKTTLDTLGKEYAKLERQSSDNVQVFDEASLLLESAKENISEIASDIDWEPLQKEIGKDKGENLESAYDETMSQIKTLLEVTLEDLNNNRRQGLRIPDIDQNLEVLIQFLELIQAGAEDADMQHVQPTLDAIKQFRDDYQELYNKSNAFQTTFAESKTTYTSLANKIVDFNREERITDNCEELQKTLVKTKDALVAVIDKSYAEASFYDELMKNNVDHYTLEDGISQAGVEFANKHHLDDQHTALISKMIRHGGEKRANLTANAIDLYECVPSSLRELLQQNSSLRGGFNPKKLANSYPDTDSVSQDFIKAQLGVLGEPLDKHCAALYMQDEKFQKVINAELASGLGADDLATKLQPAIKKAEQRSKIRGFASEEPVEDVRDLSDEAYDEADEEGYEADDEGLELQDEAEVKALKAFQEEIDGFQTEMKRMEDISDLPNIPPLVPYRLSKLQDQLERAKKSDLTSSERKESLKYFKSQVQEFKDLVNDRIHLAHDTVSTMAKENPDTPMQLSLLATAYVEQVSDLAKDNRRQILGFIPAKYIPIASGSRNKYFDADLDASTASLKTYISQLKDSGNTAQLRALVESLSNDHNATMGGSPHFATADTFTDSIASDKDKMERLADQLNSRLLTLGASIGIEEEVDIKQLPVQVIPTQKPDVEEGNSNEDNLDISIAEGGPAPGVERLVSQEDRFAAIYADLSKKYQEFTANQEKIDSLESKDSKALKDYDEIKLLKEENKTIISEMDELNKDISAHNRSVLSSTDGLLNRMLISLKMADKVPTLRDNVSRILTAIRELVVGVGHYVYNAVSAAYTRAKIFVMNQLDDFQKWMKSNPEEAEEAEQKFAPGSVWSTKDDTMYTDEDDNKLGPEELFACLNFQISSVNEVEVDEAEDEAEDEYEIEAKIHQGTLDASIDKYISNHSLPEIKEHFENIKLPSFTVEQVNAAQAVLEIVNKSTLDKNTWSELAGAIKTFLSDYKETEFTFEESEMGHNIGLFKELRGLFREKGNIENDVVDALENAVLKGESPDISFDPETHSLNFSFEDTVGPHKVYTVPGHDRDDAIKAIKKLLSVTEAGEDFLKSTEGQAMVETLREGKARETQPNFAEALKEMRKKRKDLTSRNNEDNTASANASLPEHVVTINLSKESEYDYKGPLNVIFKDLGFHLSNEDTLNGVETLSIRLFQDPQDNQTKLLFMPLEESIAGVALSVENFTREKKQALSLILDSTDDGRKLLEKCNKMGFTGRRKRQRFSPDMFQEGESNLSPSFGDGLRGPPSEVIKKGSLVTIESEADPKTVYRVVEIHEQEEEAKIRTLFDSREKTVAKDQISLAPKGLGVQPHSALRTLQFEANQAQEAATEVRGLNTDDPVSSRSSASSLSRDSISSSGSSAPSSKLEEAMNQIDTFRATTEQDKANALKAKLLKIKDLKPGDEVKIRGSSDQWFYSSRIKDKGKIVLRKNPQDAANPNKESSNLGPAGRKTIDIDEIEEIVKPHLGQTGGMSPSN